MEKNREILEKILKNLRNSWENFYCKLFSEIFCKISGSE